MKRRFGVRLAVMTAGLLLFPAAMASAQEAETGVGEPSAQVQEADGAPKTTAQDDETGIGDAASVECAGTLAVTVVDLDGQPVDGAVLSVAGQQIDGAGTVTTTCGEVGGTLLAAPEGYAPAGATSKTARVTNGSVNPMTFQVDEVEVLGVTLEQPAEPAPPAAEPAPTADDDDAEAAPTLANTGPEEAPRLALLALLCAGVGVACLRVSTALRV